jgi:hypothetical protein
MHSFRRVSMVRRVLVIVGAMTFLGLFAAVFMVTKAAPKKRGRKPPQYAQIQDAGGSLDYWLGIWDATVMGQRKYADLPPADREVLEWARTRAANDLGAWVVTPKARQANVESPLKILVPSENERARRYGEAWTDPSGNEWRATDGQRENEFWMQTRLRYQTRDVVLGMSFKDVDGDPDSFEFYYVLSLDNAETWLIATGVDYSRAGSLAH